MVIVVFVCMVVDMFVVGVEMKDKKGMNHNEGFAANIVCEGEWHDKKDPLLRY